MLFNIKSLCYCFWQVKVQDVSIFSRLLNHVKAPSPRSGKGYNDKDEISMCSFCKGFIKGQAIRKMTGRAHMNMPVFKSTPVPFDGKLKILLRQGVITSCPFAQNLHDTAVEFALID